MARKKKSMVYPVVFILILTVLLTGILAFLNKKTEPVIAFNSELELKQKILKVFQKYDPKMSPEEMSQYFDTIVKTENTENGVLYILQDQGKDVAYAVPFNGPGLWGSIEGYLGITADFKKTTGIEFIKQDETPGLGGRIAEEPYKAQYKDLDISSARNGQIVINRPAPGGNIDAISGATQTSTFVVKMINEDISRFIQERGAK